MTGTAQEPRPSAPPPSGPPQGERVLQLEIPPRRDQLKLARDLVLVAGRDAHLAPQRLDNLQLAVSEACANAIRAHEQAGVRQPILVRALVDATRVEVLISDRGSGFDPEDTTPLPEPEDPRRLDFENGLGLELMRALSDRLEIRSSSAGTSVRVVMLVEPVAG